MMPTIFSFPIRKSSYVKRGLSIEEIENLIKEREVARNQKDWARADAIRKELSQLDIVLKDSANSTSWMIE